MNLVSTRWFPLPDKVLKHEEQTRLKEDLINERYRNYTIVAGRRSYKTERFLKRLFVTWSESGKNERNFLGSPTRQQSKEIFWNDIKQLSSKSMIKKISEVDLKITYNSGTTLQIVGLQEFRRVQGGFAHRVGITEYQECDEALFSESFQPMLNDVNGIFVCEGRPFGKNHLFDNFQKGKKQVSGYSSYHWTSREILSDEQIQRAKTDLAELDYKREYDASFDTMTGVPYYAFSDKNYSNYKLNIKKPVIVACDFNATNKPMSWVIGQVNNNATYWVKSLSNQFTNTETMCGYLENYFNDTYDSLPALIWFYGDYSGSQERSNSSKTDWQIIENYFKPKTNIDTKIKPCKSIRNSIGATNAQLCNTLGEVRQFIHPENCKELERDWIKAEWNENGKELKDANPLIGHSCRAVDYYNDLEHSIFGKPIVEWKVR